MKICIVANDSWLTRKTCGGAEKQVAYIAMSLADEGHEVDLYTVDNDITIDIEGVHIMPAWDRSKGLHVLRYFTHRMPTLRKRIIDNDYDILYLRGHPVFAVSAVKAARSAGVVSVLGLANDHNVSWKHWKSSNPTKSLPWYLLEAIKYAYYRRGALKRADVIGVQNGFQRAVVTDFGGRAVSIPNIFIPIETSDSISISNSIDVIWIGRFQFIKGIRELALIVKQLPQLSFMIIGKSTGDLENELLQEVLKCKNVQYHKHVDNSKIECILNASKVFLNTSVSEGFPNTFLEAWYSEVPVVSLNVNPNNLFNNQKLGICANGNINIAINKLLEYVGSTSLRNEIGARAKKYVIDQHSSDLVIHTFEEIYSIFGTG